MSIYATYIIKSENEIVGYCTLMPWKKQEAYILTAEVSIYLKPEFCNKKIGSKALEHLEKIAQKNNIKTIIAGCCTENIASVKLFEKNNYIQCAHFKNVGYKFGRALDTVYLQKHF